MALVNPWVTIDTSRLEAGLAVAFQYSTREPELIVRSTAFWVAVKAQEKTPFVEQATIDAELGTIVTPKLTKTGKEKSQKYAKNKIYSSDRMVSISRGARQFDVPLAVAIIQASVIRPDIGATPSAKRYNRLTNFRFARLSSPFRGVSRAKGREAMREAVDRMIKARHSSTHFLAAGWGVVAKKLRSTFYGGTPETEGIPEPKDDDLGAVTFGRNGDEVFVRIENLIGMRPGERGDNSANYNEALHRHGGPALQEAVDEQAAEMQTRYFARAESQLARPVNALWK